MQGLFHRLLAAALVAWVASCSLASCSLNDHGLGAVDASHPGSGSAGTSPAITTGVAGSGVAGGAGTSPDPAGTAGIGSAAGDGNDAATGTAGVTGTAGDGAGGDPTASGAAGDSTSGGGGAASPAGASGASGMEGDATAGAVGADAAAGAGGTAGAAGSVGTAGAAGSGLAGTAGHPGLEMGCSDGTREGFTDVRTYPNIASCAGAWDEPGFTSSESRTAECDYRSGNDGEVPDGRGCSVADLCAPSWHVCETAHAVGLATGTYGCTDAIGPSSDKMAFYATRQRASGLACDATNQNGSNNIYGCGNIGSAADKNSCAPLSRMLRDSDCQSQPPWLCSDGQAGATDELDIATKQSSSHGGVLCCKN
jgi:hypothetical protein